MTKTLNSLRNIILILIISTPKYFLNWSLENIENKNNSINLPIEIIKQENGYYCVSACIQMIFKYLNVNINQYTQHKIFQDLNGVVNQGIIVSQEIANYLNSHILYNSNYFYHFIFPKFGLILQEQLVFQNYVYNSLINNYPLIFIFYPTENPNNIKHAVIISGIILNLENPWLTKYIIANPWNLSIVYSGKKLNNFFKFGSALIGNNFNSEFKK